MASSRNVNGTNSGPVSTITQNVSAQLNPSNSGIAITAYAPEGYGAVGDGIADDTVPVQRAITAAIANRGIFYAPNTYRLTNTINIVPATGTQVFLGMEGQPTLGNQFIWAGPPNQSVFYSLGWKNSAINNIGINCNNKAGIVAWDMDSTAAISSTSNLDFTSCFVTTGTGGNCVGWRGAVTDYATAPGAGDVSFINFYNCEVSGQGISTDIGWLPQRANCLNWSWFGGASIRLGTGFTNIRAAGGQGGGASMFFYGYGTSHNGTDFIFDNSGAYGIFGGRFEVGGRFLQLGASGNTSSWQCAVKGVDISAYAPGDNIIIAVYGSGLLDMSASQIVNYQTNALYTSAMLTMSQAANAYAAVSITNCQMQAADPFYSISGAGTSRLYAKNNTIGQYNSAAPTGFFTNRDI